MPATVTLDVFSGRPNPEWTLDAAQEAQLRARLASLSTTRDAPLEPPGLGYRGLLLRLDTGPKFRVCAGTVAGPGTLLLDRGRALERWLLASAGARLDAGLLSYIQDELDSPQAP